MRFVATLISGILFIVSLFIPGAINNPVPDYCGTSLALIGSIDNPTVRYLDTRTGVIVHTGIATEAPDRRVLSPDESAYAYLRDKTIFLSPANGNSEVLLYQDDAMTSFSWSADSRAVIVQSYDEVSEESHIMSFDTETETVNFEYDFIETRRWNATPEYGYPYLYAPFIIDPEENRQGVMFMDSITGDITRFVNPTTTPYLLSGSGRWLASPYNGAINIIDPLTGTYHPNFTTPIPGGNFQWQDDDVLWFMRRSAGNQIGLWRATLDTGEIDSVIQNVRLKTLSANGQMAYVRNLFSNEMSLIRTVSGEEFTLDIHTIPTLHFNIPAFSQDGRCIAVLITNFPDIETHQLWVADTTTTEILLEMPLSGEISTIDWLNPGQ